MRPKRAWFDKDLSRCFLLTGERVIQFHSIPYEGKPISQILLGRYWNELPRRKQRGIECHSVLDTESSPFLWIPASAGMTTNAASRGELTLSD